MNKYSLLVLFALSACDASLGEEPPIYGYRVVNVYPHDEKAFTQGLFFREGWLYESTGLRGSSSIRKVHLDSGRVVQQRNLDNQYFGEGIVDWKENLIAVTWHSGQGFIFSIDDFAGRGRFNYDGEGWGLTRSDSHLIMSDGTAILRFLDPISLEVERSVTVTLNGRAVRNLNELEWVEGEIFSNVWHSDQVIRIDPVSGTVTGLIELSGLLSDADKLGAKTDVLNGIAYDAESNRLFVTGKNWPKLFEIELFEKPSEN
jgi:glutamine cyclotransferase